MQLARDYVLYETISTSTKRRINAINSKIKKLQMLILVHVWNEQQTKSLETNCITIFFYVIEIAIVSSWW